MHQYYILEIQQYQNGEFGHIVHFAYDIDPEKARLKGEAKYYEVLSAAAVSELPTHGATLIGCNNEPIMNKSYTHGVIEAPEVLDTPEDPEGE